MTDATGYQLAQLLTDAVTALTAAARITVPPLTGQTTTPQLINWTEFVCAALAGAAANIGGTTELLTGRPENPDTTHVRALIGHTLGAADSDSIYYRTEPLTLTVHLHATITDCARQLAEGTTDCAAKLDHLAAHLAHNHRELAALGAALKDHLENDRNGGNCPITASIDLSPHTDAKPMTTATAALIAHAADAVIEPWLTELWTAAGGHNPLAERNAS